MKDFLDYLAIPLFFTSLAFMWLLAFAVVG
jgi:hypothetical protein